MNLSETKRALLEKWLQGQANDEPTGIPRRPENSPVTLSFPQQRQLFLELLERGTAVNNLAVLLDIKGNLDTTALEQSANNILARHDALRTGFIFTTGLPTPSILQDVKLTIPVVDLQKLGDSEKANEARRLAEKEAAQPFDLTQSPLIRLKLYTLNREWHFILVLVHHTIADGWSLGVFLRELIMFYENITTAKPIHLPELPIQYADFAHWQAETQQSESVQDAMRYWKKQLGGSLPVLELPTDEPRGARQTFNGGTYQFVISKTQTEALEKMGKQEDATLYMTLLTAFYILLYRYSRQDEIIVGTPVANRNHPSLEHLIGVFINTIALRTDLSGDPGFSGLLRQVRQVALDAYAHQELPFEKLVEALKPKRDLSRTPVFQVVFNLQNAPMPTLEIPGLSLTPMDIGSGVSQFDLTLMITKSEGQCRATVAYNSDLFSSATITRMFGSFSMLLEDAIANPECPVSQLQIVGKEELQHLVYGLNQTPMDFPRQACMHQLFEEQARQTPDAVAIIYKDVSLRYSELNNRANALARHLQQMGIGPEMRMGILMEKTIDMVVALLGVQKAGGTYVPIHTSFPEERIQYILKDAEVRVLLTNLDSVPLENTNLPVIHLNTMDFSEDKDGQNPKSGVTPNNLAYIIYTSGSTGQPKGVMVEHAALVNFLWSMRRSPGIKSTDVLLTVTSISFDIAALELFLPLITGATLVVPDKDTNKNPFLLSQTIHRYPITMMQATPATWQLLIESGWAGEPGLKALCGGEALTRSLADKLLERVDILWNMYGPTETTIWSSACRIEKGNAPVTIGQPIGNTQLYILDKNLQPVPIGVVGELHIGGDGLARGYLNQPLLTADKFIPDILRSQPGARLYKTGDRARYLPNGAIDVIGRMDDQVKINGHRIELGEISSVLTQHPCVQEAVAITRTETSGEKRLVAYFVSRNHQTPDTGALQDFVRKKLPVYMTPVAFIPLMALPLSPNGKIDRKALPMPEDVRPFTGYEAPRNEAENILAGIWQSVLNMEQVGIHDNFFDLGGASIQSLQIVAHANMAGLRLNAEHIFEYQTISALADHLQANA